MKKLVLLAVIALGSDGFAYDATTQPNCFYANVLSRSSVEVHFHCALISQHNLYGFVFERRSERETSFTELPNSFCPAPSPPIPPNCVYTDNTVQPGTWYYRSLQFDLDGTKNPIGAPIRVDVLDTSLTLIRPIDGEQWPAGSTQRIVWSAMNIDSIAVYFSTNGGITWTLWRTPFPAHPESLAFVVPAYPYNCNYAFRVSATTGGFSDASTFCIVPPDLGFWREQATGTTAHLFAVRAVNASVAWVAGTGRAVLRTTSGGNTWTSVGGGAIDGDVFAMDAVNGDTALVSTTPAATFIYRTANGGVSWSQVFSQQNGLLNGIRMLDAMNGIAVGDPVGGKWTVVRTLNSGASWSRIATEPPQIGAEFGWTGSLATFGTTRIWFGTNNSIIYRSTDLGATWMAATTPVTNIQAIWFNSSMMGLASGSSTMMIRTTDGGLNWSSLSAPCAFTSLTGLPGTRKFWGVCSSGIFYSSDSGSTWTSNPPHGYSATGLSVISITGSSPWVSGWAVGIAGKTVHYQPVVDGAPTTPARIPEHFMLHQNYPNPFNPTTTIRFTVPVNVGTGPAGIALAGRHALSLRVYDVLGREVATLVNEVKEPGTHAVTWDASGFASGMYFCRLTSGQFVQTKKTILIR
ncbi:MAG: T9SS type A sorting domain-containing protein [Ignavibacteriae bacterium]|nr:T9SS type A sorting domain-containing protein [Ignavibacteriota bacterium]